MLYFLDSNICITFLREGKKADLIRRKILLHTRKNVQIPSVVSGELMHGAFKSNNAENMNKVKRFLSKFVIVSFDYEESEIYGQIRTDLERSGKLISFSRHAHSRNSPLLQRHPRNKQHSGIFPHRHPQSLRLDNITLPIYPR